MLPAGNFSIQPFWIDLFMNPFSWSTQAAEDLGNLREHVVFVHAFSGCDSFGPIWRRQTKFLETSFQKRRVKRYFLDYHEWPLGCPRRCKWNLVISTSSESCTTCGSHSRSASIPSNYNIDELDDDNGRELKPDEWDWKLTENNYEPIS
jgi:hypothetical protein